MKDGYIYHTEYDTSERIALGSIQRAGDNVLAVLSRSDSLTLEYIFESIKCLFMFSTFHISL